MYYSAVKPQNRLVEMFHAGTPQSVKNHICDIISQDEGHLRVLISTIAFGMGVNCRKVRRRIHCGPSKTIEMYVQECGRAGRDGLPSSCILLHNGLLSVHCDSDMKKYLQVDTCLRKSLMEHFGCSSDMAQQECNHNCCSNCQSKCSCEKSCENIWIPQVHDEAPVIEFQPDEIFHGFLEW